MKYGWSFLGVKSLIFTFGTLSENLKFCSKSVFGKWCSCLRCVYMVKIILFLCEVWAFFHCTKCLLCTPGSPPKASTKTSSAEGKEAGRWRTCLSKQSECGADRHRAPWRRKAKNTEQEASPGRAAAGEDLGAAAALRPLCSLAPCPSLEVGEEEQGWKRAKDFVTNSRS